ncbi:MAG: DUF2577 domain-containing protein [Ruminococcaceae bacterium]|nr:DUF2577 domain-containing protein [Oscillospiraceae bacterium]
MADAAELVKTIKKAALDAVKADKPVEVCFGNVISTSPLKILVEQKLTLGVEQLVLTKAVTDHWVDIEVSHFTVNDNFMIPNHTHNIFDTHSGGGSCDTGNLDTTHKHEYKGKKKILVYNGLKTGEKVLLIRFDKGQRFVVLDRVSDHMAEGEWI